MGLGHRRVTRYILSKSKLKFCFFAYFYSGQILGSRGWRSSARGEIGSKFRSSRFKCKKGSAFHTIADQTPVRDYCKRQGPDVNFPVLAMDAIKMWYVKDKGYDGSFACEVRCSQPA